MVLSKSPRKIDYDGALSVNFLIQLPELYIIAFSQFSLFSLLYIPRDFLTYMLNNKKKQSPHNKYKSTPHHQINHKLFYLELKYLVGR